MFYETISILKFVEKCSSFSMLFIETKVVEFWFIRIVEVRSFLITSLSTITKKNKQINNTLFLKLDIFQIYVYLITIGTFSVWF